MRLSEQLADAMVDAGVAERVPLYHGQYVVVRTPDGNRVADGWVVDLDEDRGLVRIHDLSAGTDRHFDVDMTRYVLWIRSDDPAGWSDGRAIDLFVNQPGKDEGPKPGRAASDV